MSADAPQEEFHPEHFRAVILARMKELDLDNDTIGDHGGPSSTKMTDIRKPNPKPPRTDVYRKLDNALRWRKGSAYRVGQGGQPTPLAPLEDLEQVMDAVRRRLDEPERSAALTLLERAYYRQVEVEQTRLSGSREPEAGA